MFANLAGSSGTDHGVPLFMIFLALVADLLPTDSGRRIKQVLRRLASEWGVSGELERSAYRAAQRVGGRGDRKSALLIQIDPHPIRSETYTVKHWYGWSDEPGVLDKRGEQVVGWAGLERGPRHRADRGGGLAGRRPAGPDRVHPAVLVAQYAGRAVAQGGRPGYPAVPALCRGGG